VRLRDQDPRLMRLVLINSCEADYVEIRPEQSTHLAGDNGDGKTAILNSLQLLMIDDWAPGVMHFPRDNKTSAMFYFPSNTSHIVYEIRDQLNDHHLIWYVGRTAASKEKYDRFVINGPFSQDMFLDDEKQSRSKESVIEYVGKYRNVEPFSNSKELRTYLRQKLKWYPISQDYQSKFNRVNRQLCQLSDMRASDLKRILLDVADLKITEFNFDEDFSSEWSRLSALSEQLRELDEREPDLKLLRELMITDAEIQEKLHARAVNAAKLANASEMGRELECKGKETKLSSLENQIIQEEAAFDELSRSKEMQIGIKSNLSRSIDSLKVEKSWASNVSLSEIDKTILDLEKNQKDLTYRIQNLDEIESRGKTHHQLVAEHEEIAQKINKYSTLLREIEHSVANEISHLSLPLSDTMWSIIDRNLLLEVGTVSDQDRFKSVVSKLESQGPQFLGIDIPNLETTPLDEHLNPSRIEAKINDFQHELQKIEKLIIDFENKAKLNLTLGEVQEKIFNTKKQKERYSSWHKDGESKLQSKQDELKETISELDRLELEAKAKRGEIDALKTLKEEIIRDLGSYDFKLEELQKRWDDSAYVLDFPVTESTDFSIDEFESAISDLENRIVDSNQSEQKLSRIRQKLLKLSHLFGIDIADENSSSLLLEQHSNIETLRENTHKAWSSLSKGVFGTLKELERGLAVLQAEIETINDRFRKTKVNNLEIFKVNFRVHESETKVFKTLDQLGGPLFQYSNDNSDDRLNAFRTELEKNSRIQISRCFDLSFEYKKIGGFSETITKLDHVGSQGQRTVVKSVLLLLLISKFKLASTNQIRGRRRNPTITPVVLDEVGTLGAGHYGEVLEVANKLGFQIFTASPKAVSGADVVIPLLKNQSNRLVILDESRRPRPRNDRADSGEEE